MKVYNREIKLSKLFKKGFELSIMLFRSFIFKKPSALINAYLRMEKPPNNYLKLRNGLTIYLSNNPHDSLTVAVIFCRKEYGEVNKNDVVIDVGANIGTYSLFAASKGAKKVYAIEPNKEAYEKLTENIKKNNYEDTIIPIRAAIGGKDGEKVQIPKSSSPYNKTLIEKSLSEDFEYVTTISLNSVFNRFQIDRIDILKMDCEGAEYDAIFNTDISQLKKVQNLRLENHNNNMLSKMDDYVKKAGLKREHRKYLIVWYKKY